jgi:hypothetical protein
MTGYKQGKAGDMQLERAIRWMRTLNKDAAEVLRPLVVQPIHGGVVGGRQPDEEVLRLHWNEPGQQLLETSRRIFGGTPSARGEVCQFHAPCFGVHGSPPEG